jgi:hypothetical protein
MSEERVDENEFCGIVEEKGSDDGGRGKKY